ncbi:MAG: hypothetical protein IJU69_02035 [Bacteroidales bacterium]|nr:hypothetical protein [Bacteroidales bacterium]
MSNKTLLQGAYEAPLCQIVSSSPRKMLCVSYGDAGYAGASFTTSNTNRYDDVDDEL